MAQPPRPVLGATRARQGRYGRHMFWVLVFGTLLATLGLFAAWTWRSGDLADSEPSAASKTASAQAFDAPEPAAVIPQPARQPQMDQPAAGKDAPTG